MIFTSQNNIRVAVDVVSRISNDNTVIVMKMTDDNFFFKINGVAAEMWGMFADKKENLGEVTKALSSCYGVTSDKVIEDSQVFLNKALELKLIELV